LLTSGPPILFPGEKMTEVPSDIPPEIQAKLLTTKHSGWRGQKGSTFTTMMNLVIAYIITIFALFGYIANTYSRSASGELLFLWRYANPFEWTLNVAQSQPFIAYSCICFVLGYTEIIYPHAIKKGFWLGIFIMITTWLIFMGLHPAENLFMIYFSSIEGYLTIAYLLGAGMGFSYIGIFFKTIAIKKRGQELEYLTQLRKKE
jgi:hypothetical protein